MTRRVLLIANTHSRRCADLAQIATAAFSERGFELTAPELPAKEHLPQLIRDEASRHDLIAVLGGDGTINAVLAPVLEAGLPLAVLPGGTANDFARTMNLPTDMPGAVDIIATGRLRAIDVAEVNGHFFVNAASLGLTEDVTKQLDKETKKKWGVIAYALAAWKAIRRARGFHARINQYDSNPAAASSTRSFRSVQVVVGNGRYFGSGMTVEEDAAIDDGMLNLYSVRALPWWQLLFLLPALRFGTHTASRHVHNLDGTRFSIQTHRPMSVSADGEILTNTPATFAVHPGALKVFSPEEK